MFHKIRLVLLTIIVMVLAITAIQVSGPTAVAQEGNQTTCPAVSGEAEEPPVAKLYTEYNFTDGDVGLHGLADADGWSLLCVYDPAGTQILTISPQATIRDQLLSELFFEAAEPPISELSLEDFSARFPEGEYEFRYVLEDDIVASRTAHFTHAVPAAPTIVAPQVAGEEEAQVISVDDMVVQWEPVTQTVNGDPVNIVGYQVIIVNEDYENPNALAAPEFNMHVPADRTSVTVSPEFFQPDTLYNLEILAIEESGNQTIGLGYFMTGSDLSDDDGDMDDDANDTNDQEDDDADEQNDD